MKKIILTHLLFICALTSKAQMNLIRNGSFENYSSCPIAPYEAFLANAWLSIDTSYNVLDTIIYHRCEASYFNACANLIAGDEYGEPINSRFRHYPRTGNGMIGFIPFYLPNSAPDNFQREYLQQHLQIQLITGKSYCVTFYVINTFSSGFSINHIGAYFDDGSIDTNNICVWPMMQYTPPQILDTDIINDSVNWVKIQGSFIATGTENFITIGNFYDSAHTSILPITTMISLWSFYLIDDISVINSDSLADAGPDRYIGQGDTTWIGVDSNGGGMPCMWYKKDSANAIDSGGYIMVHPDTTTTYVVSMDLCGNITYDTVTVWVWPLTSPNPSKGGGLEREVMISPNPLSSLTPNVTISGNVAGCSYQVMNSIGQVLLQGVLQGNKNEMDLSGLLPGVYQVVITDPVSGMRVVKRVVKM